MLALIPHYSLFFQQKKLRARGINSEASLKTQWVKNPPAMQGTQET